MSEQNNEMEKYIDETVNEMKIKIAEISKESIDDNKDTKERLEEVAQKTISVINAAILKLKELAVNVKNSDELQNSIEFVSSKTKEISEATILKLKEIKNSKIVQDTSDVIVDNFNKGISIASEKAQDSMSFIKEKTEDGYKELEKNKTFVKIASGVNDVKNSSIKAINDFMSKPEVSEKIEKAKDITIELAEKSLDALRNWLKPENKGK